MRQVLWEHKSRCYQHGSVIHTKEKKTINITSKIFINWKVAIITGSSIQFLKYSVTQNTVLAGGGRIIGVSILVPFFVFNLYILLGEVTQMHSFQLWTLGCQFLYWFPVAAITNDKPDSLNQEKCILTVLEARSPKSTPGGQNQGVGRATAPFGGSEGESISPLHSSSGWQQSLASDHITSVFKASIFLFLSAPS